MSARTRKPQNRSEVQRFKPNHRRTRQQRRRARADVDTGCITLCTFPDEDQSEEPEPIGITRTQTQPNFIVPPARAPLAETPRIARFKKPRSNNTPQMDPLIINQAKRMVLLIFPGTKLKIIQAHDLPAPQ
ncbi:hypothetical protein TSAR_016195 [Trichomalopsis sarcophagae]|uniref:Uncharacterized protein n=1 Tax=Trichomalopsis sarcophagae TaxID=543379 RepID=A0A232EMT7_9HYME|nr:hypothetical protein TSAR_016195 [Trichomalopsis sarcophagae]